MTKQRMVQLNLRVPHNLKELMKQYIILDTHKDLSELTRDAIREKIKQDAPELYAELFREIGAHV